MESSVDSFVAWLFGELLSKFLARLGIGGPIQDAAIQIAITAIVVLVAWFVTSLPFAVLFKALQTASKLASDYIRSFSSAMLKLSAELAPLIFTTSHQFLAASRFKFFLTQQEKLVSSRFRDLSGQIDSIRANTVRASSKLSEDIRDLAKIADDLADVDLNLKDAEVPELEKEKESHAVRRNGIAYITISSPILLSLIVLNTWMLSIFFDGFIDGHIFYPVVTYSQAISVFFSIMEVSFGVAIYLKTHDVESGTRTSTIMVPILLFSLALLAIIEMYFYFLLALNFYNLTLEQTDGMSAFDLISKAWLSPLGFVIVVSLAVTGHQFVHGLFQIKQAGDHKSYWKEINQYFRKSEQYLGNIDKLKEQIPNIFDRLKTFSAFVEGDSGRDKPGLVAEAKDALDKVQNAINASDERAKNLYVEVEEHEAKKLFCQYIFMFMILIGATVLFVSLQIPLFMKAPALLDFPIVLLASLSVVEIFIVTCASHALSEQLDLVDAVDVSSDKGQSQPFKPHVIHSGPTSGLVVWAAWLVLVAIAGFTVVLTLVIQPKPNWFAFSLMFVAIGGAAWVGPSLRPTLFAVWAAIKSLLLSVAVGVLFIVSLFSWLVVIILQLLLVLVHVIAFPSLAGFPWLVDRISNLWNRLMGGKVPK